MKLKFCKLNYFEKSVKDGNYLMVYFKYQLLIF